MLTKLHKYYASKEDGKSSGNMKDNTTEMFGTNFLQMQHRVVNVQIRKNIYNTHGTYFHSL